MVREDLKGRMSHKHWIGVGAGIFLGLVFTAAGLGKLLLQTEALQFFIFNEYLSPALAKGIYIWLPRLEIVIGLLLISGVAARLGAAFSLALIAGFIINNVWLLSKGMGDEPCGCFGLTEIFTQTQLTTVGALYLDVVMLAFAIIIWLCYQSSFFDLKPWFLKRDKIA